MLSETDYNGNVKDRSVYILKISLSFGKDLTDLSKDWIVDRPLKPLLYLNGKLILFKIQSQSNINLFLVSLW